MIIPALGPKFRELIIGECNFAVERGTDDNGQRDDESGIADVRAYYDNFTHWGEKGNACDPGEIGFWRDGIIKRSRRVIETPRGAGRNES